MRAGKRRLLAALLAVLMLALCLSPYLVRAAHRERGCPGAEKCAVCRMLEASAERLRLLCCALSAICAALALRSRERLGARRQARRACALTPVLQKVRLND